MRIENGYRLRLQPTATFPRIHALVEDFKGRARPILEDKLYGQAAELATRVIDQRILGLPSTLLGQNYHPDETPIAVAYRILLDRHRAGYEENTLHFEFDCQLALLVADGDVLALLQTSHDGVRTAWECTTGVQPFSYWDDAERPDDVSIEEWAIREGLWGSALDVVYPAALAYSTICFGRYGLPVPQPDDLLERLPTRDERARRYAADRAVQHYIRRQVPAKTAMGRVLTLDAGLRWTREEQEGHAMVEIEREAIAQVLPEITEGLLIT